VSVCDSAECGNYANGWEYRLIVDIAITDGADFLSDVVYTTTSVSNGNLVDSSQCTERGSVSPTGQTFSATDGGGFECAFSCSASGPSVTITYS
jgi:hypothetical protein